MLALEKRELMSYVVVVIALLLAIAVSILIQRKTLNKNTLLNNQGNTC